MCELLAGAFTGGGCAGPADESAPVGNGMLSIYLSPDHFGTRGDFERIGRDYLDWVLAARPVDAGRAGARPGRPRGAHPGRPHRHRRAAPRRHLGRHPAGRRRPGRRHR